MKVKILEPLGIPQEDLVKKIEAAVAGKAEPVFYEDRKEDVPTLIERVSDADVVVLSNFKFPAEVMEAAPNLKYICVAFTGYDHVDMDKARELGIQVSNCAGYSTVAVSELVFGYIIALYRYILEGDKAVRTGKTSAGLRGIELAGKTFGIIGAGAIGLRVAALAKAFGCRVLAYSRTKKDVPGVEFVDLETLLQSSDIVSLHLPQNEETINFINEERIALMKEEAIFINTARGPIVDSKALAAALNNGKIAGAAIDVFETEPPIAGDHPLLRAKNCLLTPHVAFLSLEAMYKRADIVAANLKAYLEGSPINLV